MCAAAKRACAAAKVKLSTHRAFEGHKQIAKLINCDKFNLLFVLNGEPS